MSEHLLLEKSSLSVLMVRAQLLRKGMKSRGQESTRWAGGQEREQRGRKVHPRALAPREADSVGLGTPLLRTPSSGWPPWHKGAMGKGSSERKAILGRGASRRPRSSLSPNQAGTGWVGDIHELCCLSSRLGAPTELTNRHRKSSSTTEGVLGIRGQGLAPDSLEPMSSQSHETSCPLEGGLL